MVTTSDIHESPRLTDFVSKVRLEEEKLSYFEVSAYCFELYEDGKIGINAKNLNGSFVLSKKALANLAQIIEVHRSFFAKRDTKLRSIICNYLLPSKVAPETQLSVVLRDQEVIESIQKQNLLLIQRAPILDKYTKRHSWSQERRKKC